MKNQNGACREVSSVINMGRTFEDATVFSCNLSSWDVSSVTTMQEVFRDAIAFNGDISPWDVSRVENMRYMFSGASSFNRDISSWQVSRVTDMSYMFYRATAFDQDVSPWDVSGVANFNFSFSGASSFDQLLCWDTSGATSKQMFAGSSGRAYGSSYSCTSEYTALSALYASTGGNASWTSKKNWMAGDACTNSWFGVTCSSGEVVSLDCTSNSLIGSLPSELGHLTSMLYGGYQKYAWHSLMYDNYLSGTIPTGNVYRKSTRSNCSIVAHFFRS